jgi:hypothetical protein
VSLDAFNILLAIFLMGVGALVRQWPETIAGYNHLPEEKKKQVDVQGLSRFMQIHFIGIGMITLAIYFSMKFMGYTRGLELMMFLPTLIGVLWMNARGKKFYVKRRRHE